MIQSVARRANVLLQEPFALLSAVDGRFTVHTETRHSSTFRGTAVGGSGQHLIRRFAVEKALVCQLLPVEFVLAWERFLGKSKPLPVRSPAWDDAAATMIYAYPRYLHSVTVEENVAGRTSEYQHQQAGAKASQLCR